uniref:Uncharacterized protein n=1 Tax=Arcella intermedia TaxID=1963864 RepID=A0A6B2LN70_9EUKA
MTELPEEVELNLGCVSLRLIASSGSFGFRRTRPIPWRGAKGIILCYDCQNATSFWNSLKWFQEIQRYSDYDCRIVIVETKNDADNRTVLQDAGKLLADLIGVPFFFHLLQIRCYGEGVL